MARKKALNKVAKKWVAALRSGKWKQTTGHLGSESGSRCCLGVLCDLAVKDKVIASFDRDHFYLPPEVRAWAGLNSTSGAYTSRNGRGRDLSIDNDRSKKSFAKIADIIESQPQGLFN